jgi:hypothetical protein
LEELPQASARMEEARFNSSDWNAQDLSDLFLGHVLQVMQHQDNAVF